MIMITRYILMLILYAFPFLLKAQHKNVAKETAQQTYQNPIIHADYSDPDVISVGDDYYMVASSFNAAPGLPILHSNNLVHWTIVAHALQKQLPAEVFDKPQHGNGVWAPSIRFRQNQFYIFYPDPDYGIYVTRATKITGPWSTPVLVEAGKGLIDPCPLWDDNGKVYLVHAYAGSRAGFKSIIVVKELNAAADTVTGNAVLVYDGHSLDPTIEGPKFYKRNGYYYIFAPAGGVSTGWQTVLRSKSVYGPYERKVVMQQGHSTVNGPHQGAWIHNNAGEDWFVHFQDKGAYGRIVHLQPMQWKHDWPVIGMDADGDGTGDPVLQNKMPATNKNRPAVTVQDTDEFNDSKLGLQWQWNANPKPNWAFCFPSAGVIRLNAVLQNDAVKNLWDLPNLLQQKFPAEKFSVVAKISFTSKTIGERVGLAVMGTSYSFISLTRKEDGVHLTYNTCTNADKGNAETETMIAGISTNDVYLGLTVDSGAVCTFNYSMDGVTFTDIPDKFTAVPGKWIGATVGLFCTRTAVINDAGFADIDWIRIKK